VFTNQRITPATTSTNKTVSKGIIIFLIVMREKMSDFIAGFFTNGLFE
jgi:hypothetical protein